jgi:2-polyprenyl-3-methyl-5-hydroxy-6-metoxy-1,4-benzoquinol methylase
MIGSELLDDPRADPVAVGKELHDIARLNALFGGTRAVLRELQPFFERSERETWTLLDIGTGAGVIPSAAVAAAARYGLTLSPIGVDVIPAAARLARRSGVAAVIADANAPPLAPKSVDVVTVSQVLHHLPRAAAVRCIRACDVLARRLVVLADLRRSRVAMAGVWAACIGLGMDRVTRHDAVVSLRRGYTRGELNAMLEEAGAPVVATYRPGFRIVAAWEPRPARDVHAHR